VIEVGNRGEVKAAFGMETEWATENNSALNKQKIIQMVF
jgi:hypothetical protein